MPYDTVEICISDMEGQWDGSTGRADPVVVAVRIWLDDTFGESPEERINRYARMLRDGCVIHPEFRTFFRSTWAINAMCAGWRFGVAIGTCNHVNGTNTGQNRSAAIDLPSTADPDFFPTLEKFIRTRISD